MRVHLPAPCVTALRSLPPSEIEPFCLYDILNFYDGNNMYHLPIGRMLDSFSSALLQLVDCRNRHVPIFSWSNSHSRANHAKLRLKVNLYVHIGFKMFFYVVRHLDSIASYLLTGLHLGCFRSWPSLFIPSNFSSVFLVLNFVLTSTSVLFWAIFLLPFFEHGHTM